MKYAVRSYRYVSGPYADPVSNRRHTRTTETVTVLETDNFFEAESHAHALEQRGLDGRDGRVAYVVRTSDGAEYAGGVWMTEGASADA